MYSVALFGAGKIGEAIAGLLSSSGKYKVRVCDHTAEHAKRVAGFFSNCEAHKLDLKDKAAALKLLDGVEAVISALPFYCNKDVAAMAQERGIHYFDLTEDVETAKQIHLLSEKPGNKSCFMPQCGLAPGFISIAAMHLIKSFDTLETVKMRVGALPLYPNNRLKYNLTWSTEGLINEYCNLCEAIEEGRLLQIVPLEGYERLTFDGDEYEAFNTSGGLGTLAETLNGKVRQLNYKTIRYPGHLELVSFLLNDLRFTDDRESLKKIFERSIPNTAQDKCLIYVSVSGVAKEKFYERTYASAVYNGYVNKRHYGAIQITTAAGMCAVVDLLLNGKISKKVGFLKSEDVSLSDFLENQFGQYYRDEKALSGIAV